MATNADKKAGDGDSKPVTEEDLRRDKYGDNGVDDSKKGQDESDDEDLDDDDTDDTGDDDSSDKDSADDQDDESDEASDEDSDDDEDVFTKEFPNIKGDNLPDYTRNLETAYKHSTSESMRLKKENDELKAKGATGDVIGDDSDDASGKDGKKSTSKITDPTQLYVKQQMDKEIIEAYEVFSKDYEQVDDPQEYQKFTRAVQTVAKTIMADEDRIAPPRELYSKAAVILGWQPIDKKPSGKEKAGMALKGRAGMSTASGGPKKPKGKSKVTDDMVVLNRKMYPGKSDAEIRKELEPFVQ